MNRRLGEWQRRAVPATVPELRGLLRTAIAGWGFDEFEVSLAATEAITNVVQHAYPQTEGRVAVSASVRGDELVVVVCDQGMGARSFELESRSSPGLGLQLMASLCERLSVEPTSDGTTVTMWFVRRFA